MGLSLACSLCGFVFVCAEQFVVIFEMQANLLLYYTNPSCITWSPVICDWSESRGESRETNVFQNPMVSLAAGWKEMVRGWGSRVLTRVVDWSSVWTLLGIQIFVHATRPDHAAGAKIQGLAAAQDT